MILSNWGKHKVHFRGSAIVLTLLALGACNPFAEKPSDAFLNRPICVGEYVQNSSCRELKLTLKELAKLWSDGAEIAWKVADKDHAKMRASGNDPQSGQPFEIIISFEAAESKGRLVVRPMNADNQTGYMPPSMLAIALSGAAEGLAKKREWR